MFSEKVFLRKFKTLEQLFFSTNEEAPKFENLCQKYSYNNKFFIAAAYGLSCSSQGTRKCVCLFYMVVHSPMDILKNYPTKSDFFDDLTDTVVHLVTTTNQFEAFKGFVMSDLQFCRARGCKIFPFFFQIGERSSLSDENANENG